MQPTVVQFGVVVSLFALGYLLDRRLAGRAPPWRVPSPVRVAAVGLAAVGPILLVAAGPVGPAFGFDELVVGTALSLASYAVVGWALGVGATDCPTAGSPPG